MRTVPLALATHLEGRLLTLAWCWRLRRADGTEYCYTTLDKDLVIGGRTYKSAISFLPTSIDAKAGLNVDNAECAIFLAAADVTKLDIEAGIFDGSTVDYFRVNWAEIDLDDSMAESDSLGHLHGMEFLAQDWGIGQIELGDVYARFELRSKSQKLAQIITRRVEGRCAWRLGVLDPPRSYCPVNIATYTVTGTVTSVTNRRLFTDSGRGEATDVFMGGKITFTSGACSGYEMEVDSYDPATKAIGLFLDMPAAIEVGDTYSMEQGCDKKFLTCRTVYNVGSYFGGFPHVPDKDRALQYKIKTVSTT